MTDEAVDKEVDELQLAILAVYAQSKPYMARTISMLCSTLGSMLAHIAHDERSLLDDIDMAHRHIREHAADSFVKKQRLIKTGQYTHRG